MLFLLAILIYQTWTCPSLPFVKDPTICESHSWTFLFLSLVTAAVLAVPVVVAAASVVALVLAVVVASVASAVAVVLELVEAAAVLVAAVAEV